MVELETRVRNDEGNSIEIPLKSNITTRAEYQKERDTIRDINSFCSLQSFKNKTIKTIKKKS